jgi:SAM-dependent methyltransferase
MERAVFDRMAEMDNRHWWYVARRRILSAIIAREIRPRAGARILEIGCGTGHNFEMLERFGHLDALEIDEEARALASRRLGRDIGDAPLPELPGIPDGHYDLIALLDVLEHIPDDKSSLAAIARRLAPGGRMLVTVPANQWMWSAHDVAHHHHRRYSRRTLARVVREAGLQVEKISYFNSLLFPLAAASRMVSKLRGKTESDDKMPAAPLNAVLRAVFGFEAHLVGRVPLPAGVSLLAVLRTGE